LFVARPHFDFSSVDVFFSTFKSILSEKEKLTQQLEKQKDPNIMTELFLVKIQELKAEMRDKDKHISTLMERSYFLDLLFWPALALTVSEDFRHIQFEP
jgi:hypothetical protein